VVMYEAGGRGVDSRETSAAVFQESRRNTLPTIVPEKASTSTSTQCEGRLYCYVQERSVVFLSSITILFKMLPLQYTNPTRAIMGWKSRTDE
jgi:hypothetical protein